MPVDMPNRHLTAASHLPRTLLICAVLTLAFYLAPVAAGIAGLRLMVRATLTVAAVLLVAALIIRLAVRLSQTARPADAVVIGLAVALYAGLIVFAFVDYSVAVSRPKQFSGLSTKTDALYFAVTTMATVGYGDIHASGQLARAVVTVQELFNLAVLATGATVLVNNLAKRAGPDGRRGGPSPPA